MSNLVMEPRVNVHRGREQVSLTGHIVELANLPILIALTDPVNTEECDEALAWAERMEAALDNYVSEVRLIQARMEAVGRLPNWHAELPDDHPSWGAGGRSTYEQG